jgi:hypothetical protein
VDQDVTEQANAEYPKARSYAKTKHVTLGNSTHVGRGWEEDGDQINVRLSLYLTWHRIWIVEVARRKDFESRKYVCPLKTVVLRWTDWVFSYRTTRPVGMHLGRLFSQGKDVGLGNWCSMERFKLLVF